MPKTELPADFLPALDKVVGILAPKFRFGPFEVEDIKQQAAVFALEAMPRYEPRPDAAGVPTRPLENFLYTHVRNRLLNFYRDKCRRNDAPCPDCLMAERPTDAHGGAGHCDRFKSWKKRNNAKANLLSPLWVGETPIGVAPEDVPEDASRAELLALLDDAVPLELRSAWLRLRAGEPVPKAQRDAIEEIVREVLSA